MPKIDFNKVDDVQDFTPLPDGKYACTVVGIEEGATQHGDEMWRLRLVVESGPCRGRYIFDNLVFSEAAMRRVKLVCSRLGLDVSQELDLTPALVKGRSCQVTVGTEEYVDHEGKTKRRNVVPFAGYDRADQRASSAPAGVDTEDDAESDLPF